MVTKCIRITVKSVYGNDVYYPACADAQLFADVAGTKTLTPSTLQVLGRAGYEIVVQTAVWRFEG